MRDPQGDREAVTGALATVDAFVQAGRTRIQPEQALGKLKAAVWRTPLNVSVVTKFFRPEERRGLSPAVRFVPLGSHQAHIAIFDSNRVLNAQDKEAFAAFRRAAPHCVTVVWLLDHHHVYREMLQLCDEFDFAVPAHFTTTDYLLGGRALLTSTVPCACKLWAAEDMTLWFNANMHRERSNALYGGFREYPDMTRNALIAELSRLPGSAVYSQPAATPVSEDVYFGLSPEQQFLRWMSYKVSVAVPVKNDIAMRIFDALASGQIPIVPWDTTGLDHVISPEDQVRLPVLRYTRYEADHIAEIHDSAVRRYDAEGTEGAVRRHQYAMDNHLVSHRVSRILTLLKAMAELAF